jgi:guanylate kinase
MKKFPKDQFGFSVSHTTRNPREGEVNGVHYNFSTVDAMKEEIDDGKFIEYAEVHGNYYGTSVEAVRSVQSKGQVCILDIDCQGVRNVKSSSLDPYYIFIAPPSMQDLENRLRGRGTEKEEDIVKRLANAQGEMDYGQEEGNFDKYLVNDDLKSSSEELCNTIQTWYPHLVPDENPEEKEEVSVDEAAADDQEEKTVEQTETEVDKQEAEEAPDDEVNMDASEATTEVVDNCSLENEETTGEEAMEPKVDAPMDEVSPSDEDEEVVEVQVEEVKETVVEEDHPEDECEKVDVPQSPEPVAETKVEDVKAVEPSTPEPFFPRTSFQTLQILRSTHILVEFYNQKKLVAIFPWNHCK